MTNAVVFVLRENYGAAAARCLDYCAAKHYTVVGLVPGDFRAAVRMLDDGLADVIVVSSVEHADPRQDPRIEVVPRRLARKLTANASPTRRWTAPTTTWPAFRH